MHDTDARTRKVSSTSKKNIHSERGTVAISVTRKRIWVCRPTHLSCFSVVNSADMSKTNYSRNESDVVAGLNFLPSRATVQVLTTTGFSGGSHDVLHTFLQWAFSLDLAFLPRRLGFEGRKVWLGRSFQATCMRQHMGGLARNRGWNVSKRSNCVTEIKSASGGQLPRQAKLEATCKHLTRIAFVHSQLGTTIPSNDLCVSHTALTTCSMVAWSYGRFGKR